MDTEHDSGALLRGAAPDREVVTEEQVGRYVVQLLEGPTDNPYRVITEEGTKYTFWIEGHAWKTMCLIMREGTNEEKATFIGSLLNLIGPNPDVFDAEVAWKTPATS